MITERPILFSAPMVRAIIDGTKTQTRRIVKVRGVDFIGGAGQQNDPDAWGYENPRAEGYLTLKNGIPCPYGKTGDHLWVRETHFISDEEHEAVGGAILTSVEPKVYYKADDKDLRAWPGWRPSIYMPRWASRITLEVESVRVERLQAISEADAIAEGIKPFPSIPSKIPVMQYQDLWESINGPGSWEANPWVWVITFKRVKP